MLIIFQTFRSTTKLFDDFKFYDEQEKFRALRNKHQGAFNSRGPKEHSHAVNRNQTSGTNKPNFPQRTFKAARDPRLYFAPHQSAQPQPKMLSTAKHPQAPGTRSDAPIGALPFGPAPPAPPRPASSKQAVPVKPTHPTNSITDPHHKKPKNMIWVRKGRI